MIILKINSDRMSFRHVIITRFSYRFRENDPKLPLLSDNRLDERIRIFEKFCFQSVIGQLNKNFEWIVIIDPELPMKYRSILENLFIEFKESRAYNSRGPRNFWLHPWNWNTDRLGDLNWMLPYLYVKGVEGESLSYRLEAKYLATTRLDDDDCLNKNFVEMVAERIRKPPKDLGQISGFRYLSFCQGYQYQVGSKILKRTRIPLIALGLTLVAEVNKYPISVYLGSHTQIEKYIRKPELHARMLELYKTNRDLPVSHKQVLGRLMFIRSGNPTYVRTVHGFNLQKNIPRHRFQPDKHRNMIRQVMKDEFRVKIDD